MKIKQVNQMCRDSLILLVCLSPLEDVSAHARLISEFSEAIIRTQRGDHNLQSRDAGSTSRVERTPMTSDQDVFSFVSAAVWPGGKYLSFLMPSQE